MNCHHSIIFLFEMVVVSNTLQGVLYLWQHEFSIKNFYLHAVCVLNFSFIFKLTLSKLQSMIKTLTELGLLVAMVNIAKQNLSKK